MPQENSVFRPVIRHLTESSSLCRWTIPHWYCCQSPFSASLTNSTCSFSVPAPSLAVTQTLKVCILSSSPSRFYPICSSPLSSPTTFSLPVRQPPKHFLCFPCHLRAVLHVWRFTHFILVIPLLCHPACWKWSPTSFESQTFHYLLLHLPLKAISSATISSYAVLNGVSSSECHWPERA